RTNLLVWLLRYLCQRQATRPAWQVVPVFVKTVNLPLKAGLTQFLIFHFCPKLRQSKNPNQI
ncbi:MAG: hypothetical protein ACI8XV_002878, partial [Arenicella sp.]